MTHYSTLFLISIITNSECGTSVPSIQIIIIIIEEKYALLFHNCLQIIPVLWSNLYSDSEEGKGE